MARKSQATSPGKGWAAGFITAGIVGLAYASIFPLHRPLHYVIMAAVVVAFGGLAQIMGSGLDTSKKAASVEDLPVTGNEAVDRIVKRGQDMLKAIREENEKIPDPVLSRQMDEMDSIANRIFKTVIEQPGKAPQIRRFMEYYLPTTLKMLTGYRKMDERGIGGDSADQTRRKIESAMEVVLSAFKKQLDTLYQDDMLDISTDIDVLETMLKQDSLIGKETYVGGGNAAGEAQAIKEE